MIDEHRHPDTTTNIAFFQDHVKTVAVANVTIRHLTPHMNPRFYAHEQGGRARVTDA